MDNSKLTISLLLVAFLLIIVTLVTLRKNKINVKFDSQGQYRSPSPRLNCEYKIVVSSN